MTRPRQRGQGLPSRSSASSLSNDPRARRNQQAGSTDRDFSDSIIVQNDRIDIQAVGPLNTKGSLSLEHDNTLKVKGGKLSVATTPAANFTTMEHLDDSGAASTAAIVADFNTLLARLRTAGILEEQ